MNFNAAVQNSSCFEIFLVRVYFVPNCCVIQLNRAVIYVVTLCLSVNERKGRVI